MHRTARAARIAIVLAATVPLFSAEAQATRRRVRTTTDTTVVITTNRYLGAPLSTDDPRVSRYAPDGARNRYTTGGGWIYGADGEYLGRLNSNKYDPESVANPYGQYGSRYSPTSINNPYSQYGSRYSDRSATNPYATTPPVVRYTAPLAPKRAAPAKVAPLYDPLPPVWP